MAEVELKFDIPREAHEAFAGLPALAAADPSKEELLALYFDTPAHDLTRRHMALRLRRGAHGWKQALKAGHSGAGGLHSREEWEMERPGPSIDLSLFAHTPLSELAGAAGLHTALREVFRVQVARTAWEIEVAPGTRVEVALDRGEVRSGGDAEPISEVEVEILEGHAPAAFDFAERLLAAAPLRPSSVTKAQRGYRLARGEKPAPLKARAPKLGRAMTQWEAAKASISLAMSQLEANEAGALAGDDPEYLHQARVAMRRLRTALRVFRDVLGRGFAKRIEAELRAVAQATGPARDWDVLATRTLPALLATHTNAAESRAITARVAAQRGAARDEMRGVLRSPRHARLLLALARRLTQGARGRAAHAPLDEFSAASARTRHRKLVSRARDIGRLDATERHRLRVEAKRVRYAIEALAPMLPAKRVKAYLKAIAALQDDLGEANDAVVAVARLAEIGMPEALVARVRGRLQARERAAARRMRADFTRVQKVKPLWKKA
jgi:inorganic triphosphatase YgiF